MRTAITAAAIVFCCAFGFVTVYVLLTSGPDLFTGLSLVVLGLMTFGILRALTEPPNERR